MKKDLKPLRLLVVEDNPGDQLLLKSYLKRTAVPIENVLGADRLSVVTDLLQGQKIDLAFLDLTLPDCTGIESFQQLNRLLPDIPIIILSGLSDMAAALETISLGAQDYLMKGEFDEKLLAKSIQYSMERKKTLLALRESNERYQIVNQATRDVIWDWNLDTGEIFLSNSIKEVLGYANQHVTIDWVLEHMHPDDLTGVKQMLAHGLKMGIRNLKGEHRFRVADGAYKYAYSRGYVLHNSEGHPNRMIGASTDITEKRNLEKKLSDHQLSQQKLITEITIQAQEKERNELAHELHDNINQVLATVKMFLNIAQEDEEMSRDLVKRSYENVSYAIEEIRKLSKSLVAPSLGDLGLLEALKELIAEVTLASDLEVQLAYEAEGLPPKLELMLYRIVQEQLNNVMKYAQASQAVITVRSAQGHVFLSISDNGVGFDPAVKAKGIGLRNISSRVEFYSGTLAIITAPGKGCTLDIHIPL